MARLVTQVRGRLSTGTVQSIDQGPTGQYAWGVNGVAIPQQMHQTSSVYSGEALSFLGIFSYWYLAPQGTTDINLTLHFANSVGTVTFNEVGLQAGRVKVILRSASATILLNIESSIVPVGNAWHHVLLSWDLNAGNNYASDVHMYVDDIDVKPVTPIAANFGTAVEWGAGDLFSTNYRMGLHDSSINAPNLLHSGVYLNYLEYLPFSVEANRRKFITVAGLPAALGIDGSLPTGNQPLFYFDDPAASVANNRGSAGPFLIGSGGTLVNGTGPNP